MGRARTRGMVTALLCLWTGTVSSGCGKGNDNEVPLKDDTVVTAEQAKAKATAAPVTLKIQMSGLLLLVRDTAGRTHIAATPRSNHSSYIAYFQQDSTDSCSRYNRAHGICFVNMTGWFVDAIGPTAGSTSSIATLPPGVLDLSAGAGNVTVKVDSVRARSKSMTTSISL